MATAVHWLMGAQGKLKALAALCSRCSDLIADPRWLASMDLFVESEAYQVAVLTEAGEPSAMGLVTVCRQPFAESHVLLVEALWVSENDAMRARDLAAGIMAKAYAMDLEGICLPFKAAAARSVAAAGEIGGHPIFVEPVPLQYDVEGLYNAWDAEPTSTRLVTPACVFICNRDRLGAFDGVPNLASAMFFRGEGRLLVPPWTDESGRQHGGWDCPDFDALAKHFLASGFPTRSTSLFDGGVQSQLLQQGYVNQGTASMSCSFEVAAYYATNGYQNAGVVFHIDAGQVRASGPVFDAFETLIAHSEVLFTRQDMQTFATMVRYLGPLQAGRRLETWDAVAKQRARERGGMLREGDAFQLAEYVNAEDEKLFDDAKIAVADCEHLLRALETHAMRAVTPFSMARAIEITAGGLTRDVPVRLGYSVAFMLVKAQLEAALARQCKEHRQPGWDLTTFGYMAKTCRDQEVFSFGPISGSAILRATEIDSSGVPQRECQLH